MRRPANVHPTTWDDWTIWQQRYHKHGSANRYYWEVLQRYFRRKKLTATTPEELCVVQNALLPVMRDRPHQHHVWGWMFESRWISGVRVLDCELEAAEEMARDTVAHGGVLYQVEEEVPEKESRAYLKEKPTALYRHFDDSDNLLYVGISINPWDRLLAHQKNDWAFRAVRMETEWFDNRVDAASAEVAAIKTERPAHNIVHNQAA